MLTINISTTPKEGWFLFKHYLECHLTNIDGYAQSFQTTRTAEVRRAAMKTIEAVKGELLKHTEPIVEQMKASGHLDDAAKMQIVIDKVKNTSLLTKAENREVAETFEKVYAQNVARSRETA